MERWLPRFFTVLLTLHATSAQAIEKALEGLKPPHPEIPPSFWELHHWPIVIGGTGFLLALSLLVWLITLPRSAVWEDPGVVARRKLATLRGKPEDVATVARVSGIIRQYVRAVFAFPPGELTTAELCQKLNSVFEMEPRLAQETGEFLRQCDQWKFDLPSPLPQPGPVERATALVDKIEAGRKQTATVPA